MKNIFLAVPVILLLLPGISPAAQTGVSTTELEYGPHPVGFELIDGVDQSRSFPSADGSGFRGRPVRIYVWYPAREAGLKPLTVGDFISMAADDFRLSGDPSARAAAKDRLPVPLAKGLDDAQRVALMKRPLKAFPAVQSAPGDFPLLVLGQGLYYESPLSQVFLCEYLASRGYIVATCPLLGTQYRLVNLSVEDLETEVRDMEFVISEARRRKGVDPRGLGIVGYDLGGMAGLILAMRNPGVEAFISLDCAILSPHFSGLPAAHPSYREDRFVIPWMHMTQGRLVASDRQDKNKSLLNDRKKLGDNWIVSISTDSHGQFSSYAKFGIRRTVPGYWRQTAENQETVHDGICRLAGLFFDAVLKSDARATEGLRGIAASPGGDLYTVEHKTGVSPAPSSRQLMHGIIERGLAAVRPEIDRIRSADPAARVLEEKEVDWLAYHFLLWWGREDEALEVFRLNVELNPGSADAYAGLGEGCLVLSKTPEAIAAFKKALELNPDIPNVKAVLENLEKKK
jgi:pimeloyl-ACP methyl ester carboxylesterase